MTVEKVLQTTKANTDDHKVGKSPHNEHETATFMNHNLLIALKNDHFICIFNFRNTLFESS